MKVNLHDDQWDRQREREGFGWRARGLGEVLGASMIGATLYELPPGQRSFPYHYEYGNEEWLLVVAGRPLLRTPDGEFRLEPWDVVCFVEGPDGAHQVRNDGDEPVGSCSSRRSVCRTWPCTRTATSSASGPRGAGADGLVVRRGSAVDYWDGES